LGEHRIFCTNRVTQRFPPNLILTSWQSNASFNTTKTGWVVGGGAEWMATTNILLRAEYLYYNINNGDVSASAPYSPPVVAGAATVAGPPNLQLVQVQRSGPPVSGQLQVLSFADPNAR
jgi:hypothetical protein